MARLLAVIDPVWPVNGSESAGVPAWVWVAAALVVAVCVGAGVSYFGWRDRRRHTPEERAFRALARRLRLGRRGRGVVEGLARRAGVPPVALLVSEHAFRAALGPAAPSEALVRVRARVFGER